MRHDCDYLPLLADEGYAEGCYHCGRPLRGSSYCPRCRDGQGEVEPTPLPERIPGWFATGWRKDERKTLANGFGGCVLGPFLTEQEAHEGLVAANLGPWEVFPVRVFRVDLR